MGRPKGLALATSLSVLALAGPAQAFESPQLGDPYPARRAYLLHATNHVRVARGYHRLHFKRPSAYFAHFYAQARNLRFWHRRLVHAHHLPRLVRMRVVATAYCLRGTTASGAYVRHGAIAVDPRIIRLGTRIFVPHYGLGRALDTGSAIVGHRIDLWMSSCRSAIFYGRRSVTITIGGRP